MINDKVAYRSIYWTCSNAREVTGYVLLLRSFYKEHCLCLPVKDVVQR